MKANIGPIELGMGGSREFLTKKDFSWDLKEEQDLAGSRGRVFQECQGKKEEGHSSEEPNGSQWWWVGAELG